MPFNLKPENACEIVLFCLLVQHLRAQLEFAKEECRMMERKREELVRKAKQLQNRSGQKRNQG